ncbi:MAG: helix-turn-helix transcriptional regulator [Chromatiales bacterium]|nr:helix-turn-helix transcriptional regulator [Gammaproteobacteria bacterium]
MKDEIRAFRKEQGWTQAELGLRLKLRQASISKMERGEGISKAAALRLHGLAPGRFPLAQLLAEEGYAGKRNGQQTTRQESAGAGEAA